MHLSLAAGIQARGTSPTPLALLHGTMPSLVGARHWTIGIARLDDGFATATRPMQTRHCGTFGIGIDNRALNAGTTLPTHSVAGAREGCDRNDSITIAAQPIASGRTVAM